MCDFVLESKRVKSDKNNSIVYRKLTEAVLNSINRRGYNNSIRVATRADEQLYFPNSKGRLMKSFNSLV